MSVSRKSYDVFQGERFIESMRSSGYKDTSYAVAELVDNAIDANARNIDIICQERINNTTGRYSLYQISVLDDGYGMNDLDLRSALLFGAGTRGGNSKDIGKYGMGLPNASLSQCKKVEVYSWQRSGSSMCSHIDVDEIRAGNKEIPEPKPIEIPHLWDGIEKYISKVSGTLVVWNNLDRCSWITSKKIMEHSQFLIGRIYRKFLDRKDITINMRTVRVHNNVSLLVHTKKMLPNDPMYLISPSSTPGEWGAKPMFRKDITYEKKHTIHHMGQKHEIVVRYSIVKDELRTPEKPHQGSTLHGKHAGKNTGVSILRADREIVLDTHLVHTSEARDRWWGIEIDIPTALDLVVGLTNNKQQVNALSAIMNTVSLFGEDTTGEDTDAYESAEQDTSRKELLKMVRETNSDIRSMRNRIKLQKQRTTSKKSNLDKKAEIAISRDQKKGHHSRSDKVRKEMKKDQRIEVITTVLESEGEDRDKSKDIATDWVKNDKKIVFETSELDGSSFFAVQNTGGVLRVKINPNHKAYKNLLLLVEPDGHKNLSDKKRLELTNDGIWLLLASWARFEDLIENDERRKAVQNIRFDWGKQLETFLEYNEI